MIAHPSPLIELTGMQKHSRDTRCLHNRLRPVKIAIEPAKEQTRLAKPTFNSWIPGVPWGDQSVLRPGIRDLGLGSWIALISAL